MTDTAFEGERVGCLPAWTARILAALSDRLAAEGERRLLWLLVFFGAGIGVYFVLRVEPPLWPGLAATIAGAGLGAPGADAAAPPRTGHPHRTGRRHRFGPEGLAHRRRPRLAGWARPVR